MEEFVVLVDDQDRELGIEEKVQAHVHGRLHRAFSVFVLGTDRRLLLQRRAATKYHSPGRWSNTCCGHPRPGETIPAGAHRRLREEMGFDCELHRAFSFTYRADLGNGLWEHELDHVMVGRCEAQPNPDPVEVGEFRWAHVAALQSDLTARPECYTVWLGIALDQLAARGIIDLVFTDDIPMHGRDSSLIR